MGDSRTIYLQERIEQALDGWHFSPSVDSVLNAPKSKLVRLIFPLRYHTKREWEPACDSTKTDVHACMADLGRTLQVGFTAPEDHLFLPGSSLFVDLTASFAVALACKNASNVPPCTDVHANMCHQTAASEV